MSVFFFFFFGKEEKRLHNKKKNQKLKNRVKQLNWGENIQFNLYVELLQFSLICRTEVIYTKRSQNTDTQV